MTTTTDSNPITYHYKAYRRAQDRPTGDLGSKAWWPEALQHAKACAQAYLTESTSRPMTPEESRAAADCIEHMIGAVADAERRAGWCATARMREDAAEKGANVGVPYVKPWAAPDDCALNINVSAED